MSLARKAFDANAKDIERLFELHVQQGGVQPGRRYGLEVLNKSAVVLITSYWEAYCEDLAAEALDHIVKHAKSADVLPKKLKQQLAKELEEDLNDLALWAVADKGWKKLLKGRLEAMQEERNRKLNTPKADNIDELFLSAIGVDKISGSWKWDRTTVNAARGKLDRFVTLRGDIAHRGKASESVKLVEVRAYYELVQKLAAKTGGRVNTHVKAVAGKPLWK